MKKKIVPILIALVVLFVMVIVVDSGFREKVRAIIDWGPIRRWKSAELLYHLSSLLT